MPKNIMQLNNRPDAQRCPKVKVKKGDEVLIITGKDKGSRAKVASVDPKVGKVLLEGKNEYKKHQKPSQTGRTRIGGIVTIAMPIAISNVMVIDKSTNKPTRVGRKEVKGSKSQLRYAKRSGQLIDSE